MSLPCRPVPIVSGLVVVASSNEQFEHHQVLSLSAHSFSPFSYFLSLSIAHYLSHIFEMCGNLVGWQIPQQVSKDWENTFRIWSGNGIFVLSISFVLS